MALARGQVLTAREGNDIPFSAWLAVLGESLRLERKFDEAEEVGGTSVRNASAVLRIERHVQNTARPYRCRGAGTSTAFRWERCGVPVLALLEEHRSICHPRDGRHPGRKLQVGTVLERTSAPVTYE